MRELRFIDPMRFEGYSQSGTNNYKLMRLLHSSKNLTVAYILVERISPIWDLFGYFLHSCNSLDIRAYFRADL